MNRRGFSLIEVLATLALAALLMLAVMRVIASLGRTGAALAAVQEQGAPALWQQDLLARLNQDIRSAVQVQVQVEEQTLTLLGYGSLHPQRLEPDQRPARVVYRLIEHDGAYALLREQTALDETPARQQRWRELLAVGVRGFEVEAEAADQPETGQGPQRAAEPARARPTLRLRLVWDDPQAPLLEEVIQQ